MKKFAIFLPQFHTIPENNEWWGNNFTEWTHVKNSTPLFSGHEQPLIPVNNNYYNLLNKETVLWQTNLLHTYKIDGFAYYHYWFNGKKLLEKPAENLLHWKDIDQKFFFYWANHSWIKTENNRRKILIEQTYGYENDWEQHFQYLLPFFKDERYEKKNGKPVFLIFKHFQEERLMLNYFNRRCIENGFKGIYAITTYFGETPEHDINRDIQDITKESSSFDAIFVREPGCSTFYYDYIHLPQGWLQWRIFEFKRFFAEKLHCGHFIRKYNGDTLFYTHKHICYDSSGKDILYSICFSWDNTPRHKYRGYIITPISRKVFFEQMDKAKNAEYVLFNAWNEWGEGMVMEPTVSNGYKYLEWIKEWSDLNESGNNKNEWVNEKP